MKGKYDAPTSEFDNIQALTQQARIDTLDLMHRLLTDEKFFEFAKKICELDSEKLEELRIHLNKTIEKRR